MSAVAGPAVAVVLVNWNGADHTIACLASLARLEGPRPFVIVVENGSTDDSLARLAAAAGIDEMIRSPVNRGFGGGCNLAIARARAMGCRFVWLLNNDARAAPDALAALLACAEADPRIGAAGSLIYRDEVLRTLECWGGGDINLVTGQPSHFKTPAPLDYITGASLLLRLDALAEVGAFDEGYFLYWEDTDLCFRLRRAGWRLAVAVESRVSHAVTGTAGKAGRNLVRYFNDGAIRFYRRYAPIPLVPILANFLYRFLGQLKAGNVANALTVLMITLRLDRVRPPP